LIFFLRKTNGKQKCNQLAAIITKRILLRLASITNKTKIIFMHDVLLILRSNNFSKKWKNLRFVVNLIEIFISNHNGFRVWPELLDHISHALNSKKKTLTITGLYFFKTSYVFFRQIIRVVVQLVNVIYNIL